MWQFNISNNKTLPTIWSFTFAIIFETYSSEYFKVRTADSHSLGLFRCVFGVYVSLFFTSDRERYIQTFSKYCAIEKYGMLKTNTQLQYCETRGKENTKQATFFWILFMSVFTNKSIKNKRFVWDFKKCQIVTDETSN